MYFIEGHHEAYISLVQDWTATLCSYKLLHNVVTNIMKMEPI